MAEQQQRQLKARLAQLEAAREARKEAEREAAAARASAAASAGGPGAAAADDGPFRAAMELHRVLYESTAQLQVGMQTLQQRFIAVTGGAAAPEAEAGQRADTRRQEAPTAEAQGAPVTPAAEEDVAAEPVPEPHTTSQRRRSSSRDRPSRKN